MDANIRITVRGRFCVSDLNGVDLTPVFRKERALLALLAVSPEFRRSRLWLQSKLWSQKDPEKSSASLRRALANLKHWFGDELLIVETNRLEVWLAKSIQIDRRDDLVGKAELFENIEAPDPAFDDWLREVRAGDNRPLANQITYLPETSRSGTVFIIKPPTNATNETENYLNHWLVDSLCGRLEAEGAEEIYSDHEPNAARVKAAAMVLRFEVVSTTADGVWSVHLRVVAGEDRRFLWSGRFTHQMDLAHLIQSFALEAFVSQAISQVFMRFRSFKRADDSPMMQIQRASCNLYFQGPNQNLNIDETLKELSTGESAPVALAWRSFARLVELLEFKGTPSDRAGEAEGFLNEALFAQPGNPLVNAIAARVSLDAFGDFDRAQFFANTAISSNDSNPYALLANSRVELMLGNLERAHTAALHARKVAEGTPHIFAWDMEVCLTALGLGKLEDAKEAAKKAHIHNPTHRAALRYLVALSELLGDQHQSRIATKQLRVLEPGFEPLHLQQPDYPVLTLRRTGYVDALSEVLAKPPA